MISIKQALLISKIIGTLLSLCLSALTYHRKKDAAQRTQLIWSILTAIFICDALTGVSWIVSLADKLQWSSNKELLSLVALLGKRLGWSIVCVEYYLLTLLCERLRKENKYQIPTQIIAILGCIILAGIMVYIAIADFYVLDLAQRSFERAIHGYVHYYVLATLFHAITGTLFAMRNHNISKILRKQLHALCYYFLIPHTLLVILSTNIFLQSLGINNHAFIILNDFIWIGSLVLCFRRMLNLRFLNINKEVNLPRKYYFIKDFKDVIEHLGDVQSFTELERLTRRFFERAFQIHPEHTHLYIRPCSSAIRKATTPLLCITHPEVEILLQENQKGTIAEYLYRIRVLIKDELEFDYCYDKAPYQERLLTFLAASKSALFIPIYTKNLMVGYILVAQDTRPNLLFSSFERDEILIFANYVSTVMHLLQHHSVKEIAQQEHVLLGELYTKERKLQHYKESVRTLVRGGSQRVIGVGYYHQRTISWLNDAVDGLCSTTALPHGEPNHLQAMEQLCVDAIRYGIERSLLLKTESAQPVQCRALPDKNKAHAIILVYYADLADTFTIPFEQLDDIAAWEYALYLETTQSGKLIHQIVPGSSPSMLNFKIDLLKFSLTKKALLLELPSEDTTSIITILHHISLRSKLHTLSLNKPERNEETGLTLFGMGSMIAPNSPEALLLSLHDIGTLFIQNIEFLSLASQERLVEYISSGMFRPLLSEQLIPSNVRIICSTNMNLNLLVEQQKFLPELAKALASATLSLPSFLTMPRHEILHIAQQIIAQSVPSTELRHIVALQSKELDILVKQQSLSLHELTDNVRRMLQIKLQKQKIEHLISVDTTSPEGPPEIMQAIRLGKRALQDKNIMIMLWEHFHNQAKIASLLNVNRSSVNRRLKFFNIAAS